MELQKVTAEAFDAIEREALDRRDPDMLVMTSTRNRPGAAGVRWGLVRGQLIVDEASLSNDSTPIDDQVADARRAFEIALAPP